MTWYRHPGKSTDDPVAYVDSETIPYVVIPPLIIQKTKGIVRGCRARVTFNGKSVDCVVADRGPSAKIGELSIAAARAVGIPSSPRNGGTTKPDVCVRTLAGHCSSRICPSTRLSSASVKPTSHPPDVAEAARMRLCVSPTIKVISSLSRNVQKVQKVSV